MPRPQASAAPAYTAQCSRRAVKRLLTYSEVGILLRTEATSCTTWAAQSWPQSHEDSRLEEVGLASVFLPLSSVLKTIIIFAIFFLTFDLIKIYYKSTTNQLTREIRVLRSVKLCHEMIIKTKESKNKVDSHVLMSHKKGQNFNLKQKKKYPFLLY